jgi:ankyrin repeat protein
MVGQGAIAMEPSFTFDPAGIIEGHINRFDQWDSVVRHIEYPHIINNKIEGFHWYKSLATQSFTFNKTKYTASKVNAHTWVITPENVNQAHHGYVVYKQPHSQTFTLADGLKTFFPCNTNTASIIDAARNAQYKVKKVNQIGPKSIYHATAHCNNIPVKLIATSFTNSDLFFINSIYPELSSSINPHIESDIILCMKELERLDTPPTSPPLHIPSTLETALLDRNYEILENLLEAGTNPDLTIKGKTALMIAARKGWFEIVGLLLQYNANTTKKDNEGKTALEYAIASKDPFTVITLLGKYSVQDINAITNPCLLMQAISMQSPEIVALLLSFGANPDIQDDNGCTPLMRCTAFATRDYTTASKMIQVLLEYNANYSLMNRKKQTMLDLANEYRLHSISKIITEKESKRKSYISENSALMYAVHINNMQEVVALLAHAEKHDIYNAQRLAHMQQNDALVKILNMQLTEVEQQEDATRTQQLEQLEQQEHRKNKIKEKEVLSLLAKKQEERQYQQRCITHFKECVKNDNFTSLTATELLQVPQALVYLVTHNNVMGMQQITHLIERCHFYALNKENINALQLAYDNNSNNALRFICTHPHLPTEILFNLFATVLAAQSNTECHHYVLSHCMTSSTFLTLLEYALQKDEATFALMIKQLAATNNALVILNKPIAGKTILMRACELEKIDAITVLMEQGVEYKSALELCHTQQIVSIEKALQAIIAQRDTEIKEEKKQKVLTYTKTLSQQTKKSRQQKRQELLAEWFKATKENDHTMLKALLQAGADINARDNDGITALGHAAKSNSATVELLLNHDANKYIAFPDGSTALTLAVQYKNLDIVKILITYDASNKKAYINHRTKDGSTAIMFAASDGSLEMVMYLIENGADIHYMDDYDNTALIFASTSQSPDTVAYLIEQGANIEHINKNSATPLIMAAYKGHPNNLNILLQAGANFSHIDINEKSVLQFAAENGDVAKVQILLDCGVDTNHADIRGDTALIAAASKGHIAVVKLLLKNGVSLQTPSDYDYILKVANANKHNKVTEYLTQYKQDGEKLIAAITQEDVMHVTNLLEQEVNPNYFSCGSVRYAEENIEGRNALYSPIHIAVAKGNLAIVKLLIHYGANINACDSYDNTPLLIASKYGYEHIVQLLLEHNAYFAEPNIAGDIPLSVAQKGLKNNPNSTAYQNIITWLTQLKRDISDYTHVDSIKTLKNLLNRGANLNEQDENGNTLLMHACTHGNIDFIEYLLNENANVLSVNNQGKNALILAAQHNHTDAVQEILEYCEEVSNGILRRILFTKDNQQCTALSYAEQNNNREVNELIKSVIQRLIQSKNLSLPSQEDTSLTHPLIRSVKEVIIKGNLNRLIEIYESGCPIDIPDQNGETPLLIACFHGHIHIAEWLLHHKANVNYQSPTGMNPLLMATTLRRPDIIQLLLKNKANPNLDTKSLSHPLYSAIQNNDLKTAKLLIEAGAWLNQVNYYNKATPLMLAAQTGNLEAIKLLLEYGADILATNTTGQTCLSLAIQHKHRQVEAYLAKMITLNSLLIHEACHGQHARVKKLIEEGAHFSYIDVNGHNVLSTAIYHKQYEVVKILIEMITRTQNKILIANTMCITVNDNNTLLMEAVLTNNKDMVSILLKTFAMANIINHKNKNDATALTLAVNQDSDEIVTELLNYGAGLLSIRDANRNTILMHAIQAKKCNAAKAIIAWLHTIRIQKKQEPIYQEMYDIVLNAKNNSGQTAADIAQQMNLDDIYALLTAQK